MTTLDTLKQARASVLNQEWNFGYWNQCTCGHIYGSAVNGGKLESDEYVITDDMNHPIFMEVAIALGYTPTAYRTAAGWISDYTSMIANKRDHGGNVMREDAVKVIDRAIEALEAQYEKNRLDILAEAKEIVDGVEDGTARGLALQV